MVDPCSRTSRGRLLALFRTMPSETTRLVSSCTECAFASSLPFCLSGVPKEMAPRARWVKIFQNIPALLQRAHSRKPVRGCWLGRHVHREGVKVGLYPKYPFDVQGRSIAQFARCHPIVQCFLG